jgi:ubiquinone/menaquinone biosynthesis C-methylase UbiE
MSELWDAEAPTFDDEPDHGLRDPVTRAAWLALLAGHLPAPPARVADLGSGTGTLSVLLAGAGYSVSGVDFSPAMVERARRKLSAEDDVSFVVADAGDPPLEPASYDAVLCRHVLWALPDQAAALERWVQLLRPAGRLVLVEGFWHTGAGLTAARTEELLRGAGRTPTTHPLTDEVYWGGPVDDERYLVVA